MTLSHCRRALATILLTITLFTSLLPLALGQTKVSTLVAPITKDSSTSLYTIALNTSKQFLIDLAGPIVWSPCTPNPSLVQCTAPICNEANSFRYPSCMAYSNEIHHSGFCNCISATINPVTGYCFTGNETQIRINITSTNGKNPTSVVFADYVGICAPQDALTGLPQGAVGSAGFGRTNLVSLPARLAWDLSFYNKFALCLPSTSNAPGVAFFGDKPYYLLPPNSEEIDKRLSNTTLLKNPNSTDAAYYLSVKGLAVNSKSVEFSSCKLNFDSAGHGGVKLSTTIPYTSMRSDIYKPFFKAFEDATKGIQRMPKVEPFELCFNASALGSTRVGYAVPPIDIMLNDGKNWTIFGGNSMKGMGQDSTACLAFVDGGMDSVLAITLGGFQMEDCFLLFDVPTSTLGFISTLRGIETTCSNFNFTSTG